MGIENFLNFTFQFIQYLLKSNLYKILNLRGAPGRQQWGSRYNRDSTNISWRKYHFIKFLDKVQFRSTDNYDDGLMVEFCNDCERLSQYSYIYCVRLLELLGNLLSALQYNGWAHCSYHAQQTCEKPHHTTQCRFCPICTWLCPYEGCWAVH